MIPQAAIRRATARFKPCLLQLLSIDGKTRSTLTAQTKAVPYYECIDWRFALRPVFALIERHGTLVVVTQSSGVGGTRGFLPAVEGMRACAAIGVVVTHVAFQTGHTGGITGRL